jgi:hypothetical protein
VTTAAAAAAAVSIKLPGVGRGGGGGGGCVASTTTGPRLAAVVDVDDVPWLAKLTFLFDMFLFLLFLSLSLLKRPGLRWLR